MTATFNGSTYSIPTQQTQGLAQPTQQTQQTQQTPSAASKTTYKGRSLGKNENVDSIINELKKVTTVDDFNALVKKTDELSEVNKKVLLDSDDWKQAYQDFVDDDSKRALVKDPLAKASYKKDGIWRKSYDKIDDDTLKAKVEPDLQMQKLKAIEDAVKNGVVPEQTDMDFVRDNLDAETKTSMAREWLKDAKEQGITKMHDDLLEFAFDKDGGNLGVKDFNELNDDLKKQAASKDVVKQKFADPYNSSSMKTRLDAQRGKVDQEALKAADTINAEANTPTNYEKWHRDYNQKGLASDVTYHKGNWLKNTAKGLAAAAVPMVAGIPVYNGLSRGFGLDDASEYLLPEDRRDANYAYNSPAEAERQENVARLMDLADKLRTYNAIKDYRISPRLYTANNDDEKRKILAELGFTYANDKEMNEDIKKMEDWYYDKARKAEEAQLNEIYQNPEGYYRHTYDRNDLAKEYEARIMGLGAGLGANYLYGQGLARIPGKAGDIARKVLPYMKNTDIINGANPFARNASFASRAASTGALGLAAVDLAKEIGSARLGSAVNDYEKGLIRPVTEDDIFIVKDKNGKDIGLNTNTIRALNFDADKNEDLQQIEADRIDFDNRNRDRGWYNPLYWMDGLQKGLKETGFVLDAAFNGYNKNSQLAEDLNTYANLSSKDKKSAHGQKLKARITADAQKVYSSNAKDVNKAFLSHLSAEERNDITKHTEEAKEKNKEVQAKQKALSKDLEYSAFLGRLGI